MVGVGNGTRVPMEEPFNRRGSDVDFVDSKGHPGIGSSRSDLGQPLLAMLAISIMAALFI